MAHFHLGCFSPHALRYICITHLQSLFYRDAWHIVGLLRFFVFIVRLRDSISQICEERAQRVRVSLATQIQMIRTETITPCYRITSSIYQKYSPITKKWIQIQQHRAL